MSASWFGRVGAAGAILAGLVLDGSAAVAQVYRLRVVSAECTPLGCRLRTAVCSTVAVGRHRPGREIFLSAGHCVRGSVRSAAIEIGGTWRPADVLAVSSDSGDDLAVLGVAYAGGDMACVEIAGQSAAPGNAVVLESFPEGGAFQRRAGRVAAHGYAGVELVVNVPTRPGESGGAILDRDGRLVGVISATGPLPVPSQTLASGVSGIRELLRETFRAGVPRCGVTAVPNDPAAESPAEAADGDAATPPENRAPHRDGCRCRPIDLRLAELTSEIERLRARLGVLESREIPVQVLAADGRIVDERRVPLGEPIQLRLVPLGRAAGR